MIKKAFILVLTMFSVGVYGQQESQYTQYMYNTMMFNPAYTGSREVGSFFGMFRTQWVGIKGAPTNGSISYHQPMESLRNVGLGGSIFRESIGPQNQTDLAIDFSYTLNFENSKLAFGINGSGSLFQINYDELNKQDQAPVATPAITCTSGNFSFTPLANTLAKYERTSGNERIIRLSQ